MGGFNLLGALGGSGGLGAAAKSLAPWIGPATSLLGLLGGAGSQPNPANDPNYQNAQRYLGLQRALQGQYTQQATAAGQQYDQYDPQYLQAVNNEADFLKQDPYTDQYSAAALANATAGSAAAYQRANANLSASLASRGITDSSEMAGGLAGNAQAQAASDAAAQNALAYQKINTADAHRNALMNLYNGVAGTEYGRQQQAMGSEGSLDSSIYGEDMNQANQDLGLTQGANNQQAGLLSVLGSGVANALKPGTVTATTPAIPGVTPLTPTATPTIPPAIGAPATPTASGSGGQYPGVTVVPHPDSTGGAFAINGTVITGAQGDAAGIPDKGTPNSPGYDGEGDRIDSDPN